MQGITPLYHTCGKDLIIDNKIVLTDFFAESLVEQVKQSVDKMSQRDLRRQSKFMLLTMTANYVQNECLVEECGKYEDENAMVLSIADEILADAEEYNNNFDWIGIQYSEEGWYLDWVGMYLYDGICGIAVYFIALAATCGTEKYQGLSESLVQRIFCYTDSVLKNEDILQSRNTGIFSGESSIVYTYLILYTISREQRFLKYAKKHCRIISQLIDEDQHFDLLNGNAGAIIVLVHMYSVTQDSVYINIAQEAAEVLIKNKVQRKNGVGWLIRGQKQMMAGMAHGNSGIALSLARLWEAVGQERYLDVIEKAICYEDSLYDETIENWLDLRGYDQDWNIRGADTTAWCHGAPGILVARVGISRLLRRECVADPKIQQAFKKTMRVEKKESCLCHGMRGVREVIRYYSQMAEEETEKILKFLESPGSEFMTLKEKHEPGLMTGMAGIGYEFLRKNNKMLPNLLALEAGGNAVKDLYKA